MQLNDAQAAFLEKNHSAAMITLRADGQPHAVRVGVAMVDGQLWSSGTQARQRTAHVRRDPRCTLFVFEPGFAHLSLDTRVRLIEGAAAVRANVRLFRIMQGKPSGPLSWFGAQLGEAEFADLMAQEKRVIYEFELLRAYGLLGGR